MRRCAPILAVLVLAVAAYADDPLTGPTGGGQPHTNMQPFLGLNYIIAMDGQFPSRDTWDGRTLIGEVSLFAGNYAPHGWVQCDGQVLPINGNQLLYSILGPTYGGDGRTSFALPDLRGRIPLHPGTGPGLTPRALGSRAGVESVTLTEAQMPTHSHTLPLGDPTLETGGGQSHTNMQPFLALNHSISLEGADPSSTGFGGNGPTFLGEVRRFAGNFTPGGRALCDGQGQGIPDLRGRTTLHAGTGPGLWPRALGSSAGVESVTLTEAQMPTHDHTLPPTTLTTGDTGGNQPHTNMGPSFGLNHIIALEGPFPSRSGSGICEDFMGEITLFAGNYAPDGWALCDGQLLPVTGNEGLFDILGTTYGGDGQTTFALPDLRGRTALHYGAGPGLTPRMLGEKTGVEEVTLSIDQLPSHAHMGAWQLGPDVTQPGDPIVGTSANYPGGYQPEGPNGPESPPEAIDENPITKYLNFDKEGSGFVVTPSMGPTYLEAIALTTANDFPARDPASVTITGSNNGADWFPIVTDLYTPLSDERWVEEVFSFTAETPGLFETYKVIFPTLKYGLSANSMQVAEVRLIGDVPEPATLSLLGLGLAAVVVRRRRA